MQIKCIYDISTASRYLATIELVNTTPFPVDLSQTLQPHSCIHRSNQLWLQITREERRSCSICIEDGRTSLLCRESMTTIYTELDKVCRGICKDFLEILFIHRAYPSSDFAWGRGCPHSNNLWPARDNNVQTFIVVTSHSSRRQSCMPTLIFYHI